MNKTLLFILALLVGGLGALACAEDQGDGIGEYTDDAISADDKLGDKDINIRFIVVNALAQAKKGSAAKSDKINFNDGSGDNNENSVVLEPGSRADKIVNVVVEK